MTTKVILSGPKESGKTQLFNALVGREFCEDYKPTGAPSSASGERSGLKLSVWDAAGGSKHVGMLQAFAKANAHVLLVVFDLSAAIDAEDLRVFFEKLGSCLPPQAAKILVGNKSDLQGKRVDEGEARLLAEKEGFAYAEVSAKSGQGIDELMGQVIKLLKYD